MSDEKKTVKNLKEAFAGESQANRKYLAFAKKADEDGYPQVAKLFRAAAEAETIHAHNHLRALNGIGSTRENLMEAVAGNDRCCQGGKGDGGIALFHVCQLGRKGSCRSLLIGFGQAGHRA